MLVCLNLSLLTSTTAVPFQWNIVKNTGFRTQYTQVYVTKHSRAAAISQCQSLCVGGNNSAALPHNECILWGFSFVYNIHENKKMACRFPSPKWRTRNGVACKSSQDDGTHDAFLAPSIPSCKAACVEARGHCSEFSASRMGETLNYHCVMNLKDRRLNPCSQQSAGATLYVIPDTWFKNALHVTIGNDPEDAVIEHHIPFQALHEESHALSVLIDSLQPSHGNENSPHVRNFFPMPRMFSHFHHLHLQLLFMVMCTIGIMCILLMCCYMRGAIKTITPCNGIVAMVRSFKGATDILDHHKRCNTTIKDTQSSHFSV